MHSPLPSPSIRAMTHQLHPRAPASYFPPCPPPPIPPAHASAPKYPCAKPPQPGSPLVGCLRKTSDPAQLDECRTTPRRASLRHSAIPLSPHALPPKRAGASEADMISRRRPSFKLDLPPRPMPTELVDAVRTSRYTPYPEFPNPAAGTRSTYLRSEGPTAAVVCRNPFAEREYIILGPAHPTPEPGIFDLSASPSTGPGMVGLGYSLNKVRAPTPWIRGANQEGEWLSARDLEDCREVDAGMGGFAMA